MASALLSLHSIMERTAGFEISVKTMQETDAKTAREPLINPAMCLSVWNGCQLYLGDVNWQ